MANRSAHRSFTSWATVLFVALCAVANLVVGVMPAAAVTGSISGAVTDGVSPIPGVTVTAFNAYYGNVVGTATTDAGGGYTISNLAPTNTKIQFSHPANLWVTTYYANAASFAAATPIAVPAGGTATANAVLVANRGTISGTLTNSLSAPLAGLTVTAYDPVYGTVRGSTTTSAGGTYSLSLVSATYVLGFSDPGLVYATQYYTISPSMSSATQLPVTPGSSTVANAIMSRPGSITGHVQMGVGTPVNLGGMAAILATATGGTIVTGVLTDGSGNFTFANQLPGAYKVLFVDPAWLQNQANGYRPQFYNAVDTANLANLGANYAAAPTLTLNPLGALTNISATLRGADCDPAVYKPAANLAGANLAGKNLVGCDLTSANLAGADLSGANLTNAKLYNATMTSVALAGANVTNSNLGLANLTNATGINTTTGLVSASWTGTNFTGSGLDATGLNLAGKDLTGTIAPGTSFAGATMTTVKLANANVSGADFTGAVLTSCTCTSINATGANLTNADLSSGNWSNALGSSTTLNGTRFTGVNLNTATLQNAVGINAAIDLVKATTWFKVDLSNTGLDLTGTTPVSLEAAYANLSGANLTGMKFGTGLHLSHTNLTSTNLTNVNFGPSVIQYTDFTSAIGINTATNFTTSALQGCNFTGTGLDLTGKNLTSANWVSSNFSGAKFNYANMTSINLSGANLNGADVTGAVVNSAVMLGTTLTNLTGINTTVGLASIYLAAADFTGSYPDFSNVDWSGKNLAMTNLSGANLTNANLAGASFQNGKFIGTNLSGANLTGTSFSSGDLTGANLQSATIANAQFSPSNLTNANLLAAVGVPASTSATYSNTICPDGTNSNAQSNTCVGHFF